MKKMKRRTQRNILIGICAGAVLLAAVLLIQGIRRITADRADTSEGVEYIKNAESEDVAAVEEKISRLESQEGADTAEKSIKERFSNAVVLGDSIAAGFSEYDILNASSVIAESDARLGHPESLIERAKAMSPQILFLSLGIRDVTAEDGGSMRLQNSTEHFWIRFRRTPERTYFCEFHFPRPGKSAGKRTGAWTDGAV